jgi:hypothetical protein
MEMSERTGRHARGISTGKGTEEGNRMETRDGNKNGLATTEGEEGMAVKPV